MHVHLEVCVTRHLGILLSCRCFADDKPREFDDASLRILCNFSELVTRELERDIVLAEARQGQDSQQSDALGQQESTGVQQGRLLLRSLDCLTRYGQSWHPAV